MRATGIRATAALLIGNCLILPMLAAATVNVHEATVSCAILSRCPFHDAYNTCIASIRGAGLGGLIDQLDKSANSFDIESTDKPKGSGGEPNNLCNAKNGKGTGGTLRWNSKGGERLSDGTVEDSCATLYHEMNHLGQWDKGALDRNICTHTLPDGTKISQPVRSSEVFATNEENRYRNHRRLPERRKYGGVDLPQFQCDPPRKDADCSSSGEGSTIHVDSPNAWSVGDPHLFTVDGMGYDFQAVGEFAALRSNNGDMVVQVRQAPWKDSRWVSVTPAVALSVNGDRIMIEHSHESLLLRMNGKPVILKDRLDLPKGGYLVPEGRSYLIGWPEGSVLRVLRNVRGLDLNMGLAEGRKGTVSGLLGPFTGNHANAIVTKAGTAIKSDEINYKRLYREYGDSWRITQAESLFDYEPGKSTASYDDRSFPDPDPPKIPAATESSARAICERAGVPKEALAGCILDVSVTGEAGFAVTTAEALRPISVLTPRIEKETASKTDGNTQTFPLKIGDHVSVDKPGKGAGRIEMAGAVDQYTFTAQAGTVVYLKAESPCTNNEVQWELYTPANTFIGGSRACHDIGRRVLEQAGSYTIKAFGSDTATGDYGFTVRQDVVLP